MRRFTSRRGLSTVVTSALMLTAVAILGSAVVSWSNENLKTFETSLSTLYSTNTNKINEFVTIENIAFCQNCNGGQLPQQPPGQPLQQHAVNITLANSGTIGLNVTQIKINTFIYKITNGGLLPNKSNLWELNYNWQSQIPITISVTTNRVSIFTTQVSAP
jgi:hypothetical protein